MAYDDYGNKITNRPTTRRDTGRDLNRDFGGGQLFYQDETPYGPDYSQTRGGNNYGPNDTSRNYYGALENRGLENYYNYSHPYIARDFETDSLSRASDRFYQNRPFNKSANNYSGRGPKGYRRSDERIREDVCETLERDAHIDASEIEVSVRDRVVTLSGKIESRFAKRHAEDLIENLPGVHDIQNDLSVDQGFFDQAKELLTGEPIDKTDKSGTPTRSARH